MTFNVLLQILVAITTIGFIHGLRGDIPAVVVKGYKLPYDLLVGIVALGLAAGSSRWYSATGLWCVAAGSLSYYFSSFAANIGANTRLWRRHLARLGPLPTNQTFLGTEVLQSSFNFLGCGNHPGFDISCPDCRVSLETP